MKAPLQAPPQATSSPSFTPVRRGTPQRKCACGGTPGPTGECAECRRKRLNKKQKRLQRRALNHVAPDIVPPIVHDVIRSSGQALDETTRARMESTLDHDFGRVRVHTDQRAGESAKAVNAEAYTVGTDIVFAPGRYAPGTPAGQHLLAHELIHVAQQGNQEVSPVSPIPVSSLDEPHEQKAEAMSNQVGSEVGTAPEPPGKEAAGTTLQHILKRLLPSDETARAQMMGRMFSHHATEMDGRWVSSHLDAGSPLQPHLQAEMEEKFGENLSGVRIHTGTHANIIAQTLGAQAVTIGQDIMFGDAAFDPATPSGRRLLIHELAHTVQQQATSGAIPRRIPIAQNSDSSEREAIQVARAISTGHYIKSGSLHFTPGWQVNRALCRPLCNAICWASFSALCAAVAALCTAGSVITFGGLAIPCTPLVIATCGLAAFDASMCADVLCPEICNENNTS